MIKKHLITIIARFCRRMNKDRDRVEVFYGEYVKRRKQ